MRPDEMLWIGARSAQTTTLAVWASCVADTAPVANEIHMSAVYLVWRNGRFKYAVGAVGCAPGGQQPKPGRHAVDMCIDRESWMPTGEEQDAGDRLRPHPWKFR